MDLLKPVPGFDGSPRHALVMGLGRFGGGLGVSRYLAPRCERLTVSDPLDAEALRTSVNQLQNLANVGLQLGRPQTVDDLDGVDLLVVNPAVRPDHAVVVEARRRGVAVLTEIQLLVRETATGPRRSRTIGVTGSAGKSTTTAMIGHVLSKLPKVTCANGATAACGSASEPAVAGGTAARGRGTLSPSVSHTDRKAGRLPGGVHVGGNIGGSLLDRLDAIGDDDWLVLELSSFMLHHLRAEAWSPRVAVVTNLSPNHLDWHADEADYYAAKRVLIEHVDEAAGDVAVLGPGVWPAMQSGVVRVPAEGEHVPLLLPGMHNQINARLAIAAVHAATGVPEATIADTLADFPGLPHRLQHVGERLGVTLINDSKSTTPDAARLAIDSFEPGTVHVILGGYDKGSDLTPLAHHAAKKAAGIYTIGQTGDAIADAVEAADGLADRCETLARAVDAALRQARPGDVLLLSPGCASWGQFEHFEQRGERFIARATQGGAS